jgi:release factor glutamine methyltransferase
MTLLEALNEAAARVARRDAETLLAHVLKQDRTWLFLHHNDPLSCTGHASFQTLVNRRARHEPLQHITGAQEFFGLPLRVTPATLIPRPETEHLVEAVLAWAKAFPCRHPPRILDVGTGTGAVAIALAKHMEHARIYACDISLAALAVAQDNMERLGLADRIDLRRSDLLSAYPTPSRPHEVSTGGRFDVIVSNPPYVPAGDSAEMQPEVRDFEPHTALFAGDDGLEVYRRLVPQAHAALAANGLLAMEIGFGQRDALAELLAGWNHVRFIDDYAGIPRVVLAQKA